MDDNVLQTHPEHPALVQIKLMADGMYHTNKSILCMNTPKNVDLEARYITIDNSYYRHKFGHPL